MGCIRDDVDESARGVAATTTRPAARAVVATLGRSARSPASVNGDVDDYLLGRLGEDVECAICYLQLHHDPAGARLLQVLGKSGFRHNASGCNNIHVEGA